MNDREMLEAAAKADAIDPLYDKAVMIARARKRLGYADLQRGLMIGFNRASRLMEEMESRGVLKCVPTERGGHWELVRAASIGESMK